MGEPAEKLEVFYVPLTSGQLQRIKVALLDENQGRGDKLNADILAIINEATEVSCQKEER